MQAEEIARLPPGKRPDSRRPVVRARHELVQALRWNVEQGVISGKDGGVLDLSGSATRAEVR